MGTSQNLLIAVDKSSYSVQAIKYVTHVLRLSGGSRAAEILATAREGNYGAVIMGRRGISAVREFIMGRVTTKVLDGAEGPAVWIVP